MRKLRSENIRVRVTKDERNYIEAHMRENGESNLSEYIREKVLTDEIYISAKKKEALENLIYEIHKIGVNVNQIAKRYNEGTPFYSDPNILLDNLERIREMLKNYIKDAII